MYGTVAKIRIKPGMDAELERLSREQVPQIAGFPFQHVYRLDSDPEWHDGEVAFSIQA